MVKMTKQESYKAALELCGETILDPIEVFGNRAYSNALNGYIVMSRNKLDQKSTYYFLGPNGSIRQGTSITNSVPLLKQFKQELLSLLK